MCRIRDHIVVVLLIVLTGLWHMFQSSTNPVQQSCLSQRGGGQGVQTNPMQMIKDHHLLWRFDAQMFQEDFYISVDFLGGRCYIIIACLTVHLGAFCSWDSCYFVCMLLRRRKKLAGQFSLCWTLVNLPLMSLKVFHS